jgi:hypothetical protein
MADGGMSAFAIASLVIAAAGTGVAVAGSIAQGEAARKSQEFNAKVAENDAKAKMDQAAFQAQQIRDRGRKILGAQTAAASASGVSLSGSFLDVQGSTLASNELDALAAEYQGKVGANRSLAQAMMDRAEGENAQQASYWGAGSSLLTGIGHGMSSMPQSKTDYRPPSVKAYAVNENDLPGFY